MVKHNTSHRIRFLWYSRVDQSVDIPLDVRAVFLFFNYCDGRKFQELILIQLESREEEKEQIPLTVSF